MGLVYIAAFAPDAGESPGQISQEVAPAAFENIAPDSDGRPAPILGHSPQLGPPSLASAPGR